MQRAHLVLQNPGGLLEAFRLYWLLLNNVVEYFAKADLLIDDGDEENRDDDDQQKWSPPHRTPPQIGEGLGRRDECVDQALGFGQWRRLLRILGRHDCCCGHSCSLFTRRSRGL